MTGFSRLVRWKTFAGKVLVSGTLLTIFLHFVDLSSVGTAIAGADIATLALALGLSFGQMLLASVRWYLVARATGPFPAIWPTVRMSFAGMFSSQMLPTSLGGDVIRIGLAHRLGVPITRAASTVVLDRTAGLLSLLTLLGVTGFVLGNQLPTGWPVDWVRMVPPLVVAGVILALLAGERVAGWISGWTIFGPIAQILRDSSALLRTGGVATMVLMMSYAIHAAGAASIWFIAAGFGLELGYLEILGFLPIVILLVLVPISIAGWGVREGAIVTLFSLHGIDAASALAVSMVWGAIIAVSASVAGLIWFITRSSDETLPGRDGADQSTGAQAP